jgi:hypothetical protein
VTAAFGDLSGCRAAQTSGGAAKSVDASGLSVDGETARATVVPAGGPSAGEKIEVTLVKDGHVWKVDSAKANVPVGP